MDSEDGKKAGVGLAARLALLFGGRKPGDLPRPFVRKHGRYTSLKFSRSQTQSRMLSADPAAVPDRGGGEQPGGDCPAPEVFDSRR